ncbi:hypothetical protein RIR_jg10223.t3 [Rhizophagus irregularis DAOM 181602=DAOM 197198]|nr:hypothetical protein RIR_jg10223.t3 [Rhizophagus irregularis DAOM 181602=DAOM 197198]
MGYGDVYANPSALWSLLLICKANRDFPKDTVFYPVNMLCIMIALTIHAKSVLPADDLETIPVEQASK